MVIAAFQLPDGNLHVIACNVGQGDAILITYGSTQILTDGGPDASILTCLGKYMPFWDRNIELVISTHPDADHSTGLVDVVKDYNVGEILINPIDPGTGVYEALKKEVGSRGVRVIDPVEGMELRVGLIHLDILNPTQELVDKKFSVGDDTNVYSIVYKLSFKSFSGLFTGDIPPEVSDRLSTESVAEDLDYIKIPHHGSTNGLTENLLKEVMPKVAVISVGKDSWGFPKQEILDILEKFNVKILRTDQLGDIEVVTDGKSFWIR
jgi:competence protein ComEC